jgi:hypothetical protein
MAPTTHSQTLDELDIRVNELIECIKSLDQTLLHRMETLSNNIHALFMYIKGNHYEYQPEASHSSHYEHNPLSHSSWVSPNHWNKVPKVDMHEFDGPNLVRWVYKMEHYFSLHDIKDDETKIHVGVL